MTQLITHRGGCHCGAVRFEVDAPADIEVWSCNCSMCEKTAFLHLIVPASRFRLLTPWQRISTYTFNTGIAQHLFCRTCGIKSFYVPRSNPDGYSVNVRCLNAGTIASMQVKPFDGKDWEAAGAQLAHLSRET
jgi:hypothetical protein